MEAFEKVHPEVILTSAIIYIFIIVALRIVGKNEMSQLSVSDLVFVLLISNSVQDAMVGLEPTLWDGLLAASTLFIMNKVFKIFLYKSDKFARLLDGEPVILIRHGIMNKKQLKKSRISIRELKEALREQGKGDIGKIDLAILEVDGKISVIEDKDIKKGSKFDIDADALQ